MEGVETSLKQVKGAEVYVMEGDFSGGDHCGFSGELQGCIGQLF